MKIMPHPVFPSPTLNRLPAASLLRWSALAVVLGLSACGGGNEQQTGRLTAPVVAQLDYETSSGLRGQTDDSGAFQYRVGDSVTFRIGGLSLGTTTAQEQITPLFLVAGATPVQLQNSQLVRLLQILYTLDEDGSAHNGIRLSAAVRSALSSPARALADVTDVQTAVVTPALAALPAGRVLTSASSATAQFADALNRQEAFRQIAALGPMRNQLIGGGGRNCSSFNGDRQSSNCAADWTTILKEDAAFAGLSKAQISFDSDYAMPEFRYSITNEARQRLASVPVNLFDPTRKQVVLNLLDAHLSSGTPPQNLSLSELSGLQTPGHEGVLVGLSAAEQSIVRHALVVTPAQSQRKIEARSVRFLSNLPSRDIYEQFVASARALAGGGTPKIGVVTAATENAFFDADINVWALRSAGAEVVYLPFNGGLRRASDAQQCGHVVEHYHAFANTLAVAQTHHMNLVYPDWHTLQQQSCTDLSGVTRTLERLHGIYFSGGDQARHLEGLHTKVSDTSFKASMELGVLQRRVAEGKLVVSGTSAGNHIQGGGTWKQQKVPMIGGGDSYAVLTRGFKAGTGATLDTPAQATQYANGGHGFFNYGVLDSHFSQRVREGRLIRATTDSGMDYGFGVDENTALIVSQPDRNGGVGMTVLGAGGVWVVDVRQAKATLNANGHYGVDGVRAHYLIQGDALHIGADGRLSVNLATHTARPVLPIDATAAPVVQSRIMDYGSANFLKMTQQMGLTGAPHATGLNTESSDRRTQQSSRFTLVASRSADTVFRGTTDRVSYTQLQLSIRPE